MINPNEIKLGVHIKNSRTEEFEIVTPELLMSLSKDNFTHEGIILTIEIKNLIDDDLRNRIQGMLGVAKWAGKEIKFLHELEDIYYFYIGEQLKINL